MKKIKIRDLFNNPPSKGDTEYCLVSEVEGPLKEIVNTLLEAKPSCTYCQDTLRKILKILGS